MLRHKLKYSLEMSIYLEIKREKRRRRRGRGRRRRSRRRRGRGKGGRRRGGRRCRRGRRRRRRKWWSDFLCVMKYRGSAHRSHVVIGHLIGDQQTFVKGHLRLRERRHEQSITDDVRKSQNLIIFPFHEMVICDVKPRDHFLK